MTEGKPMTETDAELEAEKIDGDAPPLDEQTADASAERIKAERESKDERDGSLTVLDVDKGQYARATLVSIPTYYLGHLLADQSQDSLRWSDLSPKTQMAVRDEINRRKPVPAAPPVVAVETGTGTGNTPALGESEPEGADLALDDKLTGPGARKAKTAAESNAEDAISIIAVASLDELVNIEKAEVAGKDRVTVNAAIAKRRAELQPAPTPPDTVAHGDTGKAPEPEPQPHS